MLTNPIDTPGIIFHVGVTPVTLDPHGNYTTGTYFYTMYGRVM